METTNPQFQTRYSYKKHSGLSFNTDNPKNVSRTQQHFSKEANVNTIMKKYGKSGLLTDPTINPTRMPMYGDFSNIPTFMEAQNAIIAVKNWFNQLPPEVRSKFDNDAAKCQEWTINPDNKEEAEELGVLPKPCKAKYVSEDGTDITAEVIETRGLFRHGKRINPDGTPFVEPPAPTPTPPPEVPAA